MGAISHAQLSGVPYQGGLSLDLTLSPKLLCILAAEFLKSVPIEIR